MLLNRRAFFSYCATNTLLLTIDKAGAAAPQARISVSDLGVFDGIADARSGLQEAIKRLPRNGGTLYFPPGTYAFAESSEPAIPLRGYDNVTIEGGGCRLLFNKIAFPIVLDACRGVRLSGFVIDWERPPFSQGEITNVSADGTWSDVEADNGFPVDGSESFNALTTYDRDLGQIAKGGVDTYRVIKSVKSFGGRRLRLAFNRSLPLHAGDTVVLRDNVPGYAHAIVMRDCSDIVVRDVGVYASCAMALAAERCENLSISGFEVRPTPGSSRLLSTNADAIHCVDGRGKFEIRDLLLMGMGDDGINVNTGFLKISGLVDERSVAIGNPGGRLITPSELARSGDRLMISRAQSLQPLGEMVVVGSEAGKSPVLHFSNDIPKDVGPGDLLCDASRLPALTVSHCRFPGNRARGVLAHSSAVVQNCTFAHQSEQAIVCVPSVFWMECGSATNITIRDNVFHDTMRLRRSGQSAITIDTEPPLRDNISARNISIEENEFVDLGGSAITANAVADLRIIKNRIAGSANPTISLEEVQRVVVRQNSCDPERHVAVSRNSRDEVSLDGNTGLTVQAN